jgi:hypothetical protein
VPEDNAADDEVPVPEDNAADDEVPVPEDNAADDEEPVPQDNAAEDDEERCVCSLHTHMPPIEFTAYSRQDASLTDEQVSILQRRVAEFRGADQDTRTTIIQDVVSQLVRSSSHDANFNRELLETVRTLSATGFPSHTFVACPQISIQQVQTGAEES